MSTKEIIHEFISRELLHDAQETPLNDDDQLIESGIIDSLGIMTMLSFLEEEFSLQLPNEDLVPENFASISTIVALVERRMNKRSKP
jgi:acyl carrier protein